VKFRRRQNPLRNLADAPNRKRQVPPHLTSRIRFGNLSSMDHHPIHTHGHARKIIETDEDISELKPEEGKDFARANRDRATNLAL
jgi:FtsP/CotA-like multicopper oxidase with cupredoxin domain